MISKRNIINLFGAGATAIALSVTAMPALAGMNGDSGTFIGQSNHVTTGGVSIVEEGGKFYVELADDFSLDGGPDPRVALGNNGYDSDTLLGELRELTGTQRYEIPASVDISDYNQVFIWCEIAGVPLGVATLN
ncbi:DM13 domain-containing protein [Pseudohalocynthiibacter aestuariivivens]|jgi:Electron transfer DM13|uniref:DM13 domain-containing protein n=1 Tax=Pseudohalocynthiibacter aestuariivivens TaxID=1591409 RepID=A0ABV5JM84_9RHOB|nr:MULTISPECIES: DM13 domain-containing protein [Pseudohalocynthiibacter]MBS9717672.1 DM13 domain-containing protein [Pseudohalocynthiibacter aestuariivivens]MCK0102870.1 DM13 domain-containing protein [Pseudohalocynthiibacter sp. F2068]